MMEPRRSTGVATTKLHILDRPLSRGKTEVRARRVGLLLLCPMPPSPRFTLEYEPRSDV